MECLRHVISPTHTHTASLQKFNNSTSGNISTSESYKNTQMMANTFQKIETRSS